jgi:hypothetical protein
MANIRAVDTTDSKVKEIKSLTQKRTKDTTDTERERIAQLEWEISTYWDPKLGFYIPSQNIERCIQMGGTKDRLGKKLTAAVWLTDLMVPIQNRTRHRTLEAYYEDPAFRFRTAVRTPPRTGGRQMKSRAMIPTGWMIEFELNYDDKELNKEQIESSVGNAGVMVGLGDWRPKFGRFTSETI